MLQPLESRPVEPNESLAGGSAMVERERAGNPPKGRRRYTYNEGVDEPAKLIESEAVDIEAEVPAESNEQVERLDPEESLQTPAFEEDESSG